MIDWWSCAECEYQTNSKRNAESHELETGHDVIGEDNEDEQFE